MTPPLRTVASDASLPARADVVVIGGGIAGTAAAWELARRGNKVALIEKGSIGAEQSCRNWGWVRQQNRDERELPISILSMQIWDTLAQETGQDVGFRRSGLVYGTKSEESLQAWRDWAEMARGYGVDSRVLGPSETAALLPGNSNSNSWLGGVHSPTDGRAEPALVTPVLAADARRYGATVHQNCAARELEFSAGRVSGVVTERGTIRCDAVLVAGGAWAGMFLRHHGLRFLQAAVKSTSFFTSPAPEVTPGGAIVAEGIALRRRLDGGYTVGISGYGQLSITPWGLRQVRPFWKTFVKRRQGLSYRIGRDFLDGPESLTRWRADGVSPFERTRILDPAPEARLIKRGLDGVIAAYPQLRDIKVAHSWGGMVDVTPDAIPVIAPVLERPGLFVSAGFSGHGFGSGPGAGRLAAELIRGEAPSVDPTPFRYERMTDGTDLGAMGMI